MILDKQLELLNDQAITNAAVTSNAVYLGKTVSADPAVLVITGKNLAGGTGISVAIKTADNASMTNAVTIGTFAADLSAAPMLQVKLPYTVNKYIQVVATPTGTFTAGTISADIAYGPELAAV